MVGPVYGDRRGHRLQPQANAASTRVGRHVEHTAARPHDDAGRSVRHHGRVSEKARAARSTRPIQASCARGEAEAIRQKPLLRAYLNAEVRDQLVSGDVLAAHMWNTTAQQAMDSSSEIGFAYPAEGYAVYPDSSVILRESKRPGAGAPVHQLSASPRYRRRERAGRPHHDHQCRRAQTASTCVSRQSDTLSRPGGGRARRMGQNGRAGDATAARPLVDGDQIGVGI